jgi:predicted protein tyrosine phosphatase
MIKEILVLSRLEAELLCYGVGKTPKKNKWLLISICSPQDEMIRSDYVKGQLSNWGCKNWVSLIFDDITKKVYENIKKIYPHSNKMNKIKLFSNKNAQTIINFIDKYKNDKEDFILIIHCKAGVSRSGAVGWFTCKYLGLDQNKFLENNKNIYPNKYVLMLLESLAKMDITTEEEHKNMFLLDF